MCLKTTFDTTSPGGEVYGKINMNLNSKRILDRQAGVFLFFVILSVALRFFSFFPSVLNHDESTYLEIAREMLEGKVLYVDLIDIKPPGIFLIYALFQWLFGHSIVIMRLLPALLIAVSSFIVFKTSLRFTSNDRVAVASGTIYILFLSTWSGFGISPDIEIFFNLFTISALYVFVNRDHWLNYAVAGLLMGTGFIIKYVVLFDLIAFLLFFTWRFFRNQPRKPPGSLLLKLSTAVTGFMLPFLCVNLYYYVTGYFQEFAEITYGAVARYPREFVPGQMALFVLGFMGYFLPVFFFYFYSLFNRSLHQHIGKDLYLLSLLWVVLVSIGILVPGNTFNHYWIQVMLPVSLLAGTFFHPDHQLPRLLERLTRGTTGWIIFTVFCLVIISFSIRDHAGKKDTPRQIAAYLHLRLQPEDVLYVANHFHVLYYLLEKDCPTPYVHPSLLTSPNHRQALNLDLNKEFQRISDQKPVYVLIQRKGRNSIDWLYPFLNEHYTLEQKFSEKMELYRRKM